MQKGDKFIVVDNSTNRYKIGEVIYYDSVYGHGYHNFTNKKGIIQVLDMDYKQAKPLDRFPCDDEQANID